MIDTDMEFNDYPSNKTNIRAIAEFIDNDFFSQAIQEQIQEGLDCNTVDYLENLEVKYQEVKEKYDEADYIDLIMFMEQLYRDIIGWISDRYSVDVEFDSENLETVAKELYKFFVLNLKSITTYFLISYVQENHESIILDIPEEKLNRQILDRVKTSVDEVKYLTVTNIQEVVNHIAYMDFDVTTFLRYAAMVQDTDFNLGFVYNDETEEMESNFDWTISDDSNAMVSSITRQVINGEYDRNIIITISDTLIDLWGIIPQLEEMKSKE